MDTDFSNWNSDREICMYSKANTGFFYSKKVNNGLVEYESPLERDFFLLLDHDPSVLQYQHQTPQIVYKDRTKKKHVYTADSRVKFENGLEIIVEIKKEDNIFDKKKKKDKIEDEEYKWKAIEKWAKKRGITFIILTENGIRTPRYQNVWFCLSSSKCIILKRLISSLLKILDQYKRNGKMYNELCQEFSEISNLPIGKAAQVVCYAIYHGVVFVDAFSTEKISGTMIIRRKQYTNNSNFVPLWQEWELNIEQLIERRKKTNRLEGNNNTKHSLFKIVPEKYKEEVKQRYEIVQEWLNQPSTKRNKQWRTNFCQKWKISEKTIYNWSKDFQIHGINGLIPKHNQKGRTSSFKVKTLELLEKARKKSLEPNATLQTAHNYLVEVCNKEGIESPAFSTFRYYKYRHTTAIELARIKKGFSYYKSKFTPSFGSFQGALMPMQVLQLDNTPHDQFIVDSETRESIGTPYLCSIIDIYSRMIGGSTLSLENINSQIVTETLIQCILPKEEYLRKFKGKITLKWEIQGIPTLILVDHGKDFQSDKVKEFCKEFGIIFESVPPRTPRYKAHIESWFKTLHFSLKKEGLQGIRQLKKDRIENREYNPEKRAFITFPTAEYWLHSWFTGDWHYSTSSDGLKQAPAIRWLEAKNGMTPIILPSPREPPTKNWEILLMKIKAMDKKPRRLDDDGVVWSCIEYNSDRLQDIYRSKGVTKVPVYRDRRDISFILIEDPIKGEIITVQAKSEWREVFYKYHGEYPVSAKLWDEERKFIRQRYKNQIKPYHADKVLQKKNRKEEVEKDKTKTKRIRRQKEIAKQTKKKYKDNTLVPKRPKTGRGKKRQKKKLKLSKEELEAIPIASRMKMDRIRGD